MRFLDALGARPLLHMNRRLDEVFEDGHVRPQVEALKHHAEFGADAVDLASVGGLGASAAGLAHQDGLAGHGDDAFVGRFQQVDAAQHRALAGTRGAEDRDHVAFARLQRHALEHFERAEAFVQARDR